MLKRSRALQGILTGLLAGIVALLLGLSTVLDPMENWTWDMRVRNGAHPGKATDEIVLILLDQKSLDWGADQGLSWPWMREAYVPLLQFCNRAGAKAVIFDVLFSEPSGYGVPDDMAFGQAIADTPSFVGAMFISENEIKYPVPEVKNNADMLGNVSAVQQQDAVIRRVRLMSEHEGMTVPSLALAAYLAPKDLPSPDTSTTPIDTNGMAILRYRGPSQTHRTYNVMAVIESELRIQEGREPAVDPETLRGKYVFFGFTAQGLMDLKPTPISSVYPGVEIHATALDNLLSGDFIRPIPRWLVAAIVLLAAVLCGLLERLTGSILQTMGVVLVVFPLPGLLGVGAYDRGYWVPVFMPYAGIFLTFVATIIIKYLAEGRQKRFIKGAFKQYLSPAVIEQLTENPDRLKLGGEKRELSIFFSDLQGFTSLSEGMDPETLTTWLNTYLTAMTETITRHNGTIDKYEGDAIIAFWNAPVDQSDHAARAVRATLECQRVLSDMNPGLKKTAGKDAVMRVGLHTGAVVVGNMGSVTRFDYTIIGDAANLASRLEGINKQFGTRTLISQSTREQMGNSFEAREISNVRVVGRKDPVRVYEPMLPAVFYEKREMFESFRKGLDLYYEGKFNEACEVFTLTAEKDPPSASYLERCRALADEPPLYWDGVWIITEK